LERLAHMQDKYLNDKFDAIRHAAINISIIDNERKLNSPEKIVEAIKRYGCGAAELELKEYIESLTPQTPWTEIEKKFAQDKFGQETGYWSRIHINFLKMGYDEQHYQTLLKENPALILATVCVNIDVIATNNQMGLTEYMAYYGQVCVGKGEVLEKIKETDQRTQKPNASLVNDVFLSKQKLMQLSLLNLSSEKNCNFDEISKQKDLETQYALILHQEKLYFFDREAKTLKPVDIELSDVHYTEILAKLRPNQSVKSSYKEFPFVDRYISSADQERYQAIRVAEEQFENSIKELEKQIDKSKIELITELRVFNIPEEQLTSFDKNPYSILLSTIDSEHRDQIYACFMRYSEKLIPISKEQVKIYQECQQKINESFRQFPSPNILALYQPPASRLISEFKDITAQFPQNYNLQSDVCRLGSLLASLKWTEDVKKKEFYQHCFGSDSAAGEYLKQQTDDEFKAIYKQFIEDNTDNKDEFETLNEHNNALQIQFSRFTKFFESLGVDKNQIKENPAHFFQIYCIYLASQIKFNEVIANIEQGAVDPSSCSKLRKLVSTWNSLIIKQYLPTSLENLPLADWDSVLMKSLQKINNQSQGLALSELSPSQIVIASICLVFVIAGVAALGIPALSGAISVGVVANVVLALGTLGFLATMFWENIKKSFNSVFNKSEIHNLPEVSVKKEQTVSNPYQHPMLQSIDRVTHINEHGKEIAPPIAETAVAVVPKIDSASKLLSESDKPELRRNVPH